MLLSYSGREYSWESLGLQGIQPVNPNGNQSWIFIGSTMLKLKLQYFGLLMQRTDSLEKTLMLGKIEGRRRRDDRGWDGWMASPTQWTWVWVNSGSWEGPLGTPLGLVQWKRASWQVEAGTTGHHALTDVCGRFAGLLPADVLEGYGLYFAMNVDTVQQWSADFVQISTSSPSNRLMAWLSKYD